VIHVIAAHLTDATPALHALSDDLLDAPLARADEVNRPVPERGLPNGPGGHPRDARIIPKSRDFH
jgi:error-prone DNA polymerase